ncbi:MAG: S8 family serine peptidase [Paracoccaceae bacterium]
MPFPIGQRPVALLLLTAALALAPGFAPWSTGQGMAWADDDDEDDGGGDDDDSDRQDTVREPAARAPAAARPRRIAAAPVIVQDLPPPEFAPEIVALALSEMDLATLLGEGYSLIETVDLPALGIDMRRLSPPPDTGLIAARDRVRALATGGSADLNHFYRPDEALVPSAITASAKPDCRHGNCNLHQMVAWPRSDVRAARCPVTQQIGVIDTGVNLAHELLSGAKIELVRLAGDHASPSAMVHGTAVFSALAGTQGSRVEGLLPEASYLVADIYSRIASDERADVVALVRGLDLMDVRGIRIVNLSLAGPDNSVLETVVRRLIDERQMVLVASVGNGGPSQAVAHPAAYDGVIGVTALDRRARVYRSAQRGQDVDMAAPGVGLLLAASIRGAREKSGTSFAAPFVTAAAAVILSREPGLAPENVADRLADFAQDLGSAGRDDIFGHGSLQMNGICP